MSKFYLLLLSFLFIIFASAQKKGAKKPPVQKISAAQKATEQKVTKIKKTFFDINASTLQSKAFNYANRCGVRKATIMLYYKGSDVVKVTDLGTGDGSKAAAKWSYQYYYEKGKLIFAYQQITNGLNDKPIETRRYYLGNKLVRKIEDTKVTDNAKESIDDKAVEYQLRTIKSEADIAKIYKCG
jgi:hypothetical protein